MAKVPLQGWPWFDDSAVALFETLTPEQIAAQLVARANAGNELAAGWIDRPSRLSGFSRRLSRLAVPVTRLSAVAMVALAGAVGVMAVIR